MLNLSGPPHRAVRLFLALAALGLASAPALAKTVDAKVSSIVRADAAGLGFDPAKLDVARQSLKADVASGKIAGAYLLIGRRGKVAFQEGFGVQGPGQTTPVSDETIFRIFFPMCRGNSWVLTIGFAGNNHLDHSFDVPTALHKVRRQPIVQVRMAGHIPLQAEILGGFDKAFP